MKGGSSPRGATIVGRAVSRGSTGTSPVAAVGMYAAVTGHQSAIHRDKPGGVVNCKIALAELNLNIKVQGELIRMRPQADGVHFLLALVPDPGADHVAREHVALEQEFMIALQVVERFIQ